MSPIDRAMGTSLAASLLAATTLALCPVAASAQDRPASAFERDRNVSVQARPRPEYESQGLRRGAFIWRPSLQTSIAYSDNVFAEPENTDEDGIISLLPSIRVSSDWSSNSVEAFANILHEEYLDNSSESDTGYVVGAAGRLDVSRAVAIKAGGDYRRAFERRTSIGANSISNEPIEFDQVNLFLGASREVGRIRLAVDGGLLSTDFRDALDFDGSEIDQDFRDQTQLSVSGRADYAFSPETAFFAQLGFVNVDHDQAPVTGESQRDRDTVEARLGADFELSSLVRGRVGVGYFSTDFTSQDFSDVDGFGFDGQLEWFATPLITVTATGERGTRTSELLISPATTQTRLGLQADYEMRRNIILSAGYDYTDDNYNFIDRTDTRNDLYLGGLLLFNPNFGLQARLTRRSLDSRGDLRQADFDETRLLVGFRWQL